MLSSIFAQVALPTLYTRGLDCKRTCTCNKQLVKQPPHIASFSNSNSSRPARQWNRPREKPVVPSAGFGFGKAGAIGKSKDCPCGSGLLYTECCQVYHKSSALAPDSPEKLVRARYSAFVKRDFKFLRDTSHPDNPALKGSTTAPDVEVQKHCTYEEDLAVTCASVDFAGLDILGSSSSSDGSSATVDVVAHIKRRIDGSGKKIRDPQEQLHKERAMLVKDLDGKWLVLDVQVLDVSGAAF